MKKLAALLLAPLLALSLAACSLGDGASKDDVHKGFTKTMENYGLDKMGLKGLDPEIVDQYVTCVVDDSYDSLSPETRETLAQGVSKDIAQMKISEEDKKILEGSIKNQKCIDIITKGLLSKESSK